MKIAFYTIGCKVNQYETQALREQFIAKGYVPVAEGERADVYVINTCTVTNLADRKSRQYIRRARKINPEAVIAVVGCFVQANPEEAMSIEEIDILAGTNEKSKLSDYVAQFLTNKREKISHIKTRDDLLYYEETGIVTSMDSRTRAYLKIQEGCDRFCSYCIIPYARGGVRSRSEEEIVSEAAGLLAQGFKELVLTGINTALYGREDKDAGQGPNLRLERLLKRLSDLPGDFRIRLGSLEPTVVDAEGAKRLLQFPKLCHHLHLSLQSGSFKTLQRMNRHYHPEGYREIVRVLRQEDKYFGLTTDIIVGFPGETEEEFSETLALVNDIKFLKVHVFPYSKRKGTPAAEMKDQVSSEVKKDRSVRLSETAKKSMSGALSQMIGERRTVLFEEHEVATGVIRGFTDNYVRVHCEIESPEQAQTYMNQFADVCIETVYNEEVRGRI
ncbi:MAG: tRNA (N(6)-L-threonylcarbamoyladenosine(37)-C(2))-methylthiotransferase MtaB [Firmicutes bacterium HGW-Firmicutes-11]|jgi:threonylcarbamoyladenosine tRNA methylthiotransferase MtaB|nr:MAG: tRNA (N(6)-L-threonylcarbamoyladenosine(37)-C(2))-methylthiotransferase MtaB [Firmicutes bacterium HGW-Firmicutes-11]